MPGYNVREVFQVKLGKDDGAMFKADGLAVAGLVDGPGVTGEPVMIYVGPDGRIARLDSTPYVGGKTGFTTYGEFPNAKALRRFLQNRA